MVATSVETGQDRPPRHGARLRKAAPFLTAAFVFLVLAALYLSGARGAYRNAILTWGIEPYATPFLDTDTVLSAVRCLRIGVDVFAANPCDPLARVYDYSPLWLVLAKLPVTEAWVPASGLGVDVAFLLSLLLLPAGRTGRAAAVVSLGAVSSACVFALERGNNDLVLFVLAVAAGALMVRSWRLRLVGYGAALLAGLLKYYPMTLMMLAVRETPPRFLAVAAGAIVVVAIFLLAAGHDLVRALHLIPTGDYFGDMFGSITLAGGLSQVLHWWPGTRSLVRAVMSLAALVAALALSRNARLREDLRQLSEPEAIFLLIGSLLMLSCFFTAQNIGYRALHLVLILPSLTALHRLSVRPRVYGYCAAACLVLLWGEGWRRVVGIVGMTLVPDHLPVVMLTVWLLREALWWGVMTMLAGCVAALLLDSPMAKSVSIGVARKQGRHPAS